MVVRPGGAIPELLARLAASSGGVVEVPGDELTDWPQEEVAVLKSHALLVPGKPGESALCPGCERACVMPVQVLPRAGRPASLFIVCDKPVNINRVPVAPAALERWRVSAQSLADALARLVGADGAVPCTGVAQVLRLGILKGRKDKSELLLRVGAGAPRLLVAGHEIDLGLVLAVHQQQLALDLRWLGRCVDAPVGGAALNVEAPEERRTRLAARVAREKAKQTKAFLQVVAVEEGISASRLKQLLQAPKPTSADWIAPVSMTFRTASKKPKR